MSQRSILPIIAFASLTACSAANPDAPWSLVERLSDREAEHLDACANATSLDALRSETSRYSDDADQLAVRLLVTSRIGKHRVRDASALESMTKAQLRVRESVAEHRQLVSNARDLDHARAACRSHGGEMKELLAATVPR